MQSSILVTGGAGYIGSHVVKQLLQTGARVVILDDLSTGHRENVLAGELIVGNCGDRALVSKILTEQKITAVIHLAASLIVPESLQQPLQYYQNNVVNLCNLLACCTHARLTQFIFSSSAAVYGAQAKSLASEEDLCKPLNPYGQSKLMGEQILHDLSNATSLRYVALRYFNVGGAEPLARIGLRNPQATTLIKVATQAAVGTRSQVAIYGTDYPTLDGTGIRDYVHVEDIASAHLKALDYLQSQNKSVVLNCGYGHGYSVRQVLAAIQEAANVQLDIQEFARRAGDPAEIIADNRRISTLLDWQPKYADLAVIVESSIRWEKQLLRMTG